MSNRGRTIEKQRGSVAGRKRIQVQQPFAFDAQSCASRHEELNLVGSSQPPTDRVFSSMDHLLEVVGDQQASSARGNDVAELFHRVATTQRHPQAERRCERDGVNTASLREIAEIDAARVLAQADATVAARQACLACAAHPMHGNDAGSSVEQSGEVGEHLDASDEGVSFRRDIGRDLADGSPYTVSRPRDPVGLRAVGRDDD